MRIPELLAASILSVAVLGEGAYIIKTRSHVDALEQRLEQLSGEGRGGDDQGSGGGYQGSFRVRQNSDSDEAGAAAPPPRFTIPAQAVKALAAAAANGDPLPMPAGLDSQEAREQLRQFVVAQ